VNVNTGVGEVVEPASFAVWDWWLDLDGQPIVRVEASRALCVSIARRRRQVEEVSQRPAEANSRSRTNTNPWVHRTSPAILRAGASEGAQRRGVYLYDLTNESFGRRSRKSGVRHHLRLHLARGTRVQRYCYLAHVRICEKRGRHDQRAHEGRAQIFQGLRERLRRRRLEDSQTCCCTSKGRAIPPAYYRYQLGKHQIELVGLEQDSMATNKCRPRILVQYQARDGLKLSGYLTRPPGADSATLLPLVHDAARRT